MPVEVPVTAEFVTSANPVQLHDEARGLKTDWPACFVERGDGSWVYRVDRDDVDPAEVQAAVDNHVPTFSPAPEDEFDADLAAAASKPTLEERVDALFAALQGSNGGPGAEPRRPDRPTA